MYGPPAPIVLAHGPPMFQPKDPTMRLALTTLLMLSTALGLPEARASELPAVDQVEADARKAVKNGQLTRIEIDGPWKLERESGYDFSNLAKRAIIADKTGDDGARQQFNALVIYQRGATGNPWRFDRLFSYGFRSLDGDAPSAGLDETTVQKLLMATMRTEPARFTPVDPRRVFRIDGLRVVPGSLAVVNDHELRFEVDSLFIVDDTTQSTDPGVRKLRFQFGVEALQQRHTGEWILSKTGEIGSTPLERQALTRAQLESLPTLADAPFDQLYFGPK